MSCEQAYYGRQAEWEAAQAAGRSSCTVANSAIFNFNVDKPLWPEALVFLLFFVVLRVVIYFALRAKTTFKPGKVLLVPPGSGGVDASGHSRQGGGGAGGLAAKLPREKGQPPVLPR